MKIQCVYSHTTVTKIAPTGVVPTRVVPTLCLWVSLLSPWAMSQSLGAADETAAMPPQFPPRGELQPGGMPQLPPDMKPEDFEKMVNSIEEELKKLSPEELAQLENEARDVLKNQGIDPDTLQPMPGVPVPGRPAAATPGEFMQPAVPVSEPSTPSEIATPLIPTRAEIAKTDVHSIHSALECASILRTIIKHGGSLHRNMAINKTLAKRLKAVRKTLSDVLFYVKVIDKPEHYTRLISAEYTSLFSALETTARVLEKFEPGCTQMAELSAVSDNPYEILHVPADAPQADITKTFNAFKDAHNPEKLRTALAAEGVSEADILRQIKASKTSFETIQEAYDTVGNATTRAQTDRELAAAFEHRQKVNTAAQKACDDLATALPRCFDLPMLPEKLEDFVRQFEPIQLARKKEMEKAEAERKKEQASATKQRPSTITAGSSYDPYYYPPYKNYSEPTYRGYNDYYPTPAALNTNYDRSPYATSANSAPKTYSTGTAPSRSSNKGAKDNSKKNSGGPDGDGKDTPKKPKPDTAFTELEQALKNLTDKLHLKSDTPLVQQADRFNKGIGAIPDHYRTQKEKRKGAALQRRIVQLMQQHHAERDLEAVLTQFAKLAENPEMHERLEALRRRYQPAATLLEALQRIQQESSAAESKNADAPDGATPSSTAHRSPSSSKAPLSSSAAAPEELSEHARAVRIFDETLTKHRRIKLDSQETQDALIARITAANSLEAIGQIVQDVFDEKGFTEVMQQFERVQPLLRPASDQDLQLRTAEVREELNRLDEHNGPLIDLIMKLFEMQAAEMQAEQQRHAAAPSASASEPATAESAAAEQPSLLQRVWRGIASWFGGSSAPEPANAASMKVAAGAASPATATPQASSTSSPLASAAELHASARLKAKHRHIKPHKDNPPLSAVAAPKPTQPSLLDSASHAVAAVAQSARDVLLPPPATEAEKKAAAAEQELTDKLVKQVQGGGSLFDAWADNLQALGEQADEANKQEQAQKAAEQERRAREQAEKVEAKTVRSLEEGRLSSTSAAAPAASAVPEAPSLSQLPSKLADQLQEAGKNARQADEQEQAQKAAEQERRARKQAEKVEAETIRSLEEGPLSSSSAAAPAASAVPESISLSQLPSKLADKLQEESQNARQADEQERAKVALEQERHARKQAEKVEAARIEALEADLASTKSAVAVPAASPVLASSAAPEAPSLSQLPRILADKLQEEGQKASQEVKEKQAQEAAEQERRVRKQAEKVEAARVEALEADLASTKSAVAVPANPASERAREAKSVLARDADLEGGRAPAAVPNAAPVVRAAEPAAPQPSVAQQVGSALASAWSWLTGSDNKEDKEADEKLAREIFGMPQEKPSH